jgi:predicted dinucleotide-binding enzyme
MPEADVVIAAVPKNASEEIIVRLTEYNGTDLIDARVFTIPRLPGEKGVPTKRGLTLRPDTWRELLPEIAKALAGGGAEPAEDEPAEVGDNGDEDPFGEV